MIKYTVDDVVIARAQAKTLLKRAKAKREQAKTAPEAEVHPRYPRNANKPPMMKFNAKAKPYLLKSAKRSEEMAAKLSKKADRIEAILKERAQIERGVA